MIDDKFLESMSNDYDSDSTILRKKLKFNGKTLEEWTIQLSVMFPEELDMEDIRVLSQELDGCFAIAHNNFIVADGVSTFRQRTLEVDKLRAFTELDDERKRTLADKEKAVEIKVKDSKDKVVIAKFITEFWEEQVKILERRQKLLQDIFWAIKNRDGHE